MLAAASADLPRDTTITREELSRRQSAFASAKLRLFLTYSMGLLFLFVFGPFGISAYLAWLGVPDRFCRPVAFLSFAGAPFWAWRSDVMVKKLQIAHRVGCPICAKPLIGLTGELAMTTGRCGGCGRLIVEDERSMHE
jgi:hypothetical protein